jgi:predicted MFS family arabinose efflux permease
VENFDESGWKWWYTLLIVIGVIALISVVFAVVRKNKGNTRESLL